jgi:putative transcriptional regulator
MKTTRSYRSEITAAVHETVAGLQGAGLVDARTMREFDAACLVPADTFSPDDIRALREREQVSQPVFAHYLNVSRNLVSDWERGVKRPGGPALRLLTLVKRNGLRAIA